MTPESFVIRISELQNLLINDLNRDIVVRGARLMAMRIADRVEQKSISSKETPFGKYSTKTTLVGKSSFDPQKGYAWKEVVEAAKKNKSKTEGIHWVTYKGFKLVVLPGGYAKIRSLEQHRNTQKNFSRTREMWLNFGVKKEDRDGVVLGGRTKPSQDKINWNSEREGWPIIYPSDTEIQQLADYVAEQTVIMMNRKL